MAVLLEDRLHKKLLWLSCRHHIMELIISNVATYLFGKATGPEDTKFKDNWSYLDHTKFNILQFDLEWLNSIKIEVEQKLELIQSNNDFIRDDYKKVLELVTAVLNLPRAKKT